MDLAAIVRAVAVLTSPQDWGSREAWLAEGLRQVRVARGLPAAGAGAGTVAELEGLLGLPGDEPGWLEAALEGAELDLSCGDIAPASGARASDEALLSVVSLRCALMAGIAALLPPALPAALPTTRELRAAFGLRGREPQVALLAAEGLSNAAIAERLTLSSHTVRHYVERVLDRLGLHTRKGLALHLIGPAKR